MGFGLNKGSCVGWGLVSCSSIPTLYSSYTLQQHYYLRWSLFEPTSEPFCLYFFFLRPLLLEGGARSAASARIISRRRKDGGWGDSRCYIKRIEKLPGRKKRSTSRRHLPFLSPLVVFSFPPVSAIIGFLFSFTVFLVSLLHCEHLAIGVQQLLEFGEGGGAEQMSIGLTLGIIFYLVFV